MHSIFRCMRQNDIQRLLFAIILFYLFVLQLRVIWPFTIDDMYIPLRYAKNWLAGDGLVWNVGEPPVEGYSNFSFVLLARLALCLNIDPVFLLKTAGVVGLFYTCLAIYSIARMWFLSGLALIPCVWLLAYKGQILWSASGLETAVYEALICSAVFFIFRGLGYSFISDAEWPNWKGSKSDDGLRPTAFVAAGISLAVAGMTRPEAPALMVLFVLLLMIKKPTSWGLPYWRCIVLFCVTMLVCFVPYFLWRWHYYGRFFPNPVYCKGLTDWFALSLDKGYLNLIWPFALMALPAISHGKDNRHYFLWLPSIVYLILLIGADPIVAFDNRLFLPAFALLLPLTLQGIHIFLTRYVPLEAHYLMMYFICLVVVIFFIPMMTLKNYQHFTENPLAGEQLRKRVVTWLTANVSAGRQVVLADSGLIPYQSDLKFTDSYCLNNAEMTKKTRKSMYLWLCNEVLKTQPDVIILTALIEDGKVAYTPADACLVENLTHHNAYCKQVILATSAPHSYYRYEIFSKLNNSCSKMQQG